MAKKRRRSLPYVRIRAYRSAKTGKLVSKKYRGKKKSFYLYRSKLTNALIKKETTSSNKDVQGFREAYPGRSQKTLRKIRSTLREYRRFGFNPMDESPGLKRYFSWLREHKPGLYRPVLKAVGERMQEGTLQHVVEVEQEVEYARRKRRTPKKKPSRRSRPRKAKLDRRRKA